MKEHRNRKTGDLATWFFLICCFFTGLFLPNDKFPFAEGLIIAGIFGSLAMILRILVEKFISKR